MKKQLQKIKRRGMPLWIFEIRYSGHVLCDSASSAVNFALFGQYSAEAYLKTIFNMTSLRHLRFRKLWFSSNDHSRYKNRRFGWFGVQRRRKIRNGGRPPSWMSEVRYSCHVWCVSVWFAFSLQISRQSDNVALRYSRKAVFNVDSVRYLGLENFVFFFVTWPLSKSQLASA